MTAAASEALTEIRDAIGHSWIEARVSALPIHQTDILGGYIVSTSLYEQIGGEAAVDAAVDAFYRKVLVDDRISRFFESVDMDQQRAKQKSFLSMAFGGPNHYSGKDMRASHAHLVRDMGLDDSHFDAVMQNLAETLRELGVTDELIEQVAAIAESTRDDVLGR